MQGAPAPAAAPAACRAAACCRMAACAASRSRSACRGRQLGLPVGAGLGAGMQAQLNAHLNRQAGGGGAQAADLAQAAGSRRRGAGRGWHGVFPPASQQPSCGVAPQPLSSAPAPAPAARPQQLSPPERVAQRGLHQPHKRALHLHEVARAHQGSARLHETHRQLQSGQGHGAVGASPAGRQENGRCGGPRQRHTRARPGQQSQGTASTSPLAQPSEMKASTASAARWPA